MIPQLLWIIAVAAGLCALASIAYYLLCLWSAAAFLRNRKDDSGGQAAPAVSILKPLKGTDPGMYESLRTQCLQEYPEYEIIFGVSDPHDPAIPLVERLRREFPQREIGLVLCEQRLGSNIKVSNLAQMLKQARHEHLVVADSDIRVRPQYLSRIIAPLGDPAVGVVTCLYRGVAALSLGSRLESLGISTDFAPGVLAAWKLEGGLHFGLGSTLALRRRDLASIGGFEVLADYLGDDYELGRRIAASGLSVQLSHEVVETCLPTYGLRELFTHQLRWARTIRDARRWGYAGLIFTFGLPWALLAVLAAWGALWAWVLLIAVAVLRLAVAVTVGRFILRDPQVLTNFILIPLRDFVGCAVWAGGLFGRRIVWRGDRFELRNGKLIRAA